MSLPFLGINNYVVPVFSGVVEGSNQNENHMVPAFSSFKGRYQITNNMASVVSVLETGTKLELYDRCL